MWGGLYAPVSFKKGHVFRSFFISEHERAENYHKFDRTYPALDCIAHTKTKKVLAYTRPGLTKTIQLYKLLFHFYCPFHQINII